MIAIALRHALLGLLQAGPRHGYELKQAFEDVLAGTWEVNPGQIYTTLGRMERDGLVANEVVEQDGRPDKKVFTLTPDGKAELEHWFGTTLSDQWPRDEFLVKLLIYRIVHGSDGRPLIWQQRRSHLQTIRELVKLRQETNNPVQRLLLERTVLHLEAEIDWLDQCERELFPTDPEGSSM